MYESSWKWCKSQNQNKICSLNWSNVFFGSLLFCGSHCRCEKRSCWCKLSTFPHTPTLSTVVKNYVVLSNKTCLSDTRQFICYKIINYQLFFFAFSFAQPAEALLPFSGLLCPCLHTIYYVSPSVLALCSQTICHSFSLLFTLVRASFLRVWLFFFLWAKCAGTFYSAAAAAPSFCCFWALLKKTLFYNSQKTLRVFNTFL